MKRRQFLKGIGAATVAAAIPASYATGGVFEVTGKLDVYFDDPELYASTIDCLGNPVAEVYKHMKLVCKSVDIGVSSFERAAGRLEFEVPNIRFT